MTEEEGRLEMESINKEIEAYENRPVLEKIKDSVSDLVNDVSEFVNNIKESLGSEKEKEVSNDAFEKLLEQKEENLETTTIKTQGMTTEENISAEDYNIENSREIVSENETSKEEVSSDNEKEVSNDVSTEPKEEVSAENVSNNEIQEEKSEVVSENINDVEMSKEDLINEVYSRITNKLDAEGMDFDSNFYEFVDKSLDLNNDDRLEKHFENYGLEDAVDSRAQAFMDYSGYENSEFASEIAEHTTDSGVLNKLSNSENEDVLKAVIENENVSNYTLEQLSGNDNEKISESASETLSSREEASSENVSNNETQEQKNDEGFFSSMIEGNDHLADNRDSDFAFDRAFAEFSDNFDDKLAKEIEEKGTLIEEFKERLENEKDRLSDQVFNQEATSEKVIEENVSTDNNLEQEVKPSLSELEQKLESVNEQISNVSNEEIIESQNKLEITPEMREAQQLSEEMAREGQKENDTEYAYSADKKESAEELFNQREELTNQLEKEIENPVNGTFEIEDKLEAVNEKISQLSNDELKEYNNSLSAEITPEIREEQQLSEDLSREGQKDNDTQYGNFEYKEEVETTLSRDDLMNQLEKESGFYKDSDIENINKEELVNQLEKESSSTEDKSSLNDLIQERDSLQEQINEIKNDVSNDVESSADNLKMELAKEEFTSYAEQNLPENEREEFVNTMLDISADSIKSQETVEGVEKEINSSLESYQEVKAELEAEKNVDVSSETNLKQDVEIDKNVDSSSVNEKDVSSDLQSKDVPEAVSDKETSKEVEVEKNIDSNVNSDKEQNKQTEIDFATETGASR